MLPRYSHKLGERFRVVRETPSKLRVRKVGAPNNDGNYLYLNFGTSQLDAVPTPTAEHEKVLTALMDTNLLEYDFQNTFPRTAGEYLFEYEITSDSSLEYEIHTVGDMASTPSCRIYGYLRDVSGAPMSGQVVEAMLNRGYFPHKSGTANTRLSTITDESGYFELALMPGLDVTISIPAIGYVQRGVVPNTGSVEFNSDTLLRN